MEELIYKKQNFYDIASEKEIKDAENFAGEYMQFLDKAKTEREACREAISLAEQAGFKQFDFGQKLKKGDKRYFLNHNKEIILFKIGSNDLEEAGMKIIGAHIDSPRLDLKPNPVFEEGEMCYFKTHYYGGIRKYQYLTSPLSLHGAVVKANGEKFEFVIGENQDDPIFYISDLLPHLSQGQEEQKLREVFSGEQLNLVVGGKTSKKQKEQKLKSNVLEILKSRFGMSDADFMSSEISAVPMHKAREVGFDRAFIAGYGHDDKSCAYPALRAILESKSDETVMVWLVDKEEIGSEGNTGAQSKLFEDLIDEICENFKASPRKVRRNSKCLSADVTSAYDPNYSTVFDKTNVAQVSCGTCIMKYDGAKGKSDSNDASAELMGELRKAMEEAGVLWQTGELGRVDLGGGGTISKFIAKLNIDTIDIGVPVISMHAPYELISKADLYSTYKAFKAFFK